MAFAHAVYKRIATGSATGEWFFSDRPPLQAGFELFFTPLRGLFGNDDTHQAVGTLLQVSILAALCLLGAALRLRRQEILPAVLTIGGSGFVFYNSVYVCAETARRDILSGRSRCDRAGLSRPGIVDSSHSPC